MIRFLYGAYNPDIKYKTGHYFSDPVFVVDDGRNQHLYLDDRELEMIKNGGNLKVHSIYSFIEKAKQNKEKTSFRNKLAFAILKSFKSKKVAVSSDFPAEIADYLRNKYKLEFVSNLYPERKRKTEIEVKIIQNILKRMHKGFKRVEDILKKSQIKGNNIINKGNNRSISAYLNQNTTPINIDDNIIKLGFDFCFAIIR